MDCRPSGSSVHGISQARILEWVAIPFSRGSWPKNWTCISCVASRFLTTEPPGKPNSWREAHFFQAKLFIVFNLCFLSIIFYNEKAFIWSCLEVSLPMKNHKGLIYWFVDFLNYPFTDPSHPYWPLCSTGREMRRDKTQTCPLGAHSAKWAGAPSLMPSKQ